MEVDGIPVGFNASEHKHFTLNFSMSFCPFLKTCFARASRFLAATFFLSSLALVRSGTDLLGCGVAGQYSLGGRGLDPRTGASCHGGAWCHSWLPLDDWCGMCSMKPKLSARAEPLSTVFPCNPTGPTRVLVVGATSMTLFSN